MNDKSTYHRYDITAEDALGHKAQGQWSDGMNRLAITGCVILAAGTLAGCAGPSKQEQIKQGVSQFQVGNLDQAEATLRRVRTNDPSDPDVNYYLGRVYYARGNYELALYYFQCAYDAEPAYPDIQKAIREARQNSGTVGQALQFVPEPPRQ
jgi:Flp pilus assembly protein TadD